MFVDQSLCTTNDLKKTTNLLRHLRNKHPFELAAYEERQSCQRPSPTTSSSTPQATLQLDSPQPGTSQSIVCSSEDKVETGPHQETPGTLTQLQAPLLLPSN
ncbi:hypothetical protein PoB_007573800 [Plakobranchus ocellatus]|uniref:BED-type domain-containing protein n=1 Tax=Plakobranchus ocellatus TaxID=259542 RepID=A0AAV4DY72_9GAST|nr:hypothetical protein PoB_007573800 [Plakobranchus ocellatus]